MWSSPTRLVMAIGRQLQTPSLLVTGMAVVAVVEIGLIDPHPWHAPPPWQDAEEAMKRMGMVGDDKEGAEEAEVESLVGISNMLKSLEHSSSPPFRYVDL